MRNPLVLVLNSGSSSLKVALYNVQHACAELYFRASGIGTEKGKGHFVVIDDKLFYKDASPVEWDHPTHKKVLEYFSDWLRSHPDILDNIVAVGHRVVHGAEQFHSSVVVDDSVLAQIEQCCLLAPLHNPANLLGITVAMQLFPTVKHVAVFDTSFHFRMPERAFLYGLPYGCYKKLGIRRYGFHGASYDYVSREAAQLLSTDIKQLGFIIAHLGNGASVCAVEGGRSVDTSMGFTPLEGLVMGTRCGDLDPSIPEYLMRTQGMDALAVESFLNKKSGLLGISEISSDFRELELAAANGELGASRAIEVFAYRLAKYIASYRVALSEFSALIFTGGIGENSPLLRSLVVQQLGFLGLEIDEKANTGANSKGGNRRVSTNSGTPILVVPTNEELFIVHEVVRLTTKSTEIRA